jgi:uncharacterized protein (UPF0276 family)
MKTKLGIRWDDEAQNNRILKAKGMIDFIEVNYPIATYENPANCELPVYAHSAYNGLCSAYGINESLAQLIKAEADKYDSPWIGEHLAWLSSEAQGALGYVFNPIYDSGFFEITQQNIKRIKEIYQRPIALELGPQYQLYNLEQSLFKDEVDFLIKSANESNSGIILDLSHLIISNKNLGRPLEYGLEELAKNNTIEVHVSGIRQSSNGDFWHDCHDVLPSELTLNLLQGFLQQCSSVRAVTWEHTPDASESEFFIGLEKVLNVIEVQYVS